MVVIVACCIAIIMGIIISNLINAKFTTDENVGKYIGIILAGILMAFFCSDKGQVFLRRLIEIFPVKLK